LRFDRTANRPPKEFVLFSGGDDDFAAFTAGNYKHIIFNLGLQEGWDDPACYFAYIDKSMGSRVQIEQVIGRVLRQPHAHHLPSAELNTASFFIRVDNAKQEFPRILDGVKRRIAAETPEITVQGYTGSRAKRKLRHEPSRVLSVPHVYIESDEAQALLAQELEQIPNFAQAPSMTQGKGLVVYAVQKIGRKTKTTVMEEVRQNANRVVSRWILRRAIQELYPRVVDAIDWAEAKFDIAVELTSPAAMILREKAEKLVRIYLEQSRLTFEDQDPYEVGPVHADPARVNTSFKYALHEGYSDLRPFETEVAEAIDALRVPWVRNPSNGGYGIPLLQTGDNYNFFPDFLIWTRKHVVALDPKGEDRIESEASRKLLDITNARGRRPVVVRLLTRGTWNATTMKKTGDNGFAVWSLRNGRPHAQHRSSIAEAVKLAVAV
jgi:type III restriction enzyme